jgi:hypothetical protein
MVAGAGPDRMRRREVAKLEASSHQTINGIKT